MKNPQLIPSQADNPDIPLNPEEIRKIAEAWNSGETQSHVAARCNMQTDTLRRYLRREGLVNPKGKGVRGSIDRDLTPERRQQMIDDWNNGVDRDEMAKTYGFHPTSMRRYINEHQLVKVKPSGPDPEMLADILELKNEGLTHEQIGNRYNFSASRIGQLAAQARAKAGLPQTTRRRKASPKPHRGPDLNGIVKSLESWMSANTDLGSRDIRTVTRMLRIVARDAKRKPVAPVVKPAVRPKQMKHLGSSLAHIGRFHTLSKSQARSLLKKHGPEDLAWRYRISITQMNRWLNLMDVKS